MNITHLRRRITKFVDADKAHTYSGMSKDVTDGKDNTVVSRFRGGVEIRPSTLERMDKYLTERGF